MQQNPLERIKNKQDNPTALLILEDGTIFEGIGFGANRTTTGEVCFNTSMTGYQEIMTDPSYAGQLITFTFPHIGNTGTNEQDIETATPVALGMITRNAPTDPSSYRTMHHLSEWLSAHNIPGIGGIDTRALTHRIREQGAPKGMIMVASHGIYGSNNLIKGFFTENMLVKMTKDSPGLAATSRSALQDELVKMTKNWPGLAGMELAKEVSRQKSEDWSQSTWALADNTYTKNKNTPLKVIALDYGCKHNILRCLTEAGMQTRIVPATTSAENILAMKPHGIFLSNGPGDPAATAKYAAGEIRKLAETGLPIFGICIGHQLIAEAFGAKTYKLNHGHRGANHPVKDLASGKIEITSQNHGFAVAQDSLPSDLEITHISLFDGTIEGLKHKSLPVFSVQYHPESSPGPHDSRYLFERFAALIKGSKNAKAQ